MVYYQTLANPLPTTTPPDLANQPEANNSFIKTASNRSVDMKSNVNKCHN
jgi:hypothetical protein